MPTRTTATGKARPTKPEPGLARRATRRSLRVDVECIVGRHRYAARTLDLSKNGALLELTDPRLRPPADPQRRVEVAADLARRLGNGFGVAFAHGIVWTQAAVVRANLPRVAGEPYRVGCRFHEPLAAQDARLLGLTGEGDYEPRETTCAPLPPMVDGSGDRVKDRDDKPQEDPMPGERTVERRLTRVTRDDTAPSDAAAPAEVRLPISLDRMFSGRRRSKRTRRMLAVEIRSSDGRTCRGLTVDVSRGGALLDVNDGRLFPPGDALPLVAYAGIARDFLREGFEVHFQRGGVRADARLIRAVAGPKRGAPPFLGVRFVPVLPDEACRRLGVECGGDDG
jgi:hypothetical protein